MIKSYCSLTKWSTLKSKTQLSKEYLVLSNINNNILHIKNWEARNNKKNTVKLQNFGLVLRSTEKEKSH